jgi:hypothetical protein
MRKKFFGRQVIDDGSNGIIRQLWQNNMDVTEKKSSNLKLTLMEEDVLFDCLIKE